MRVKSIRAQAFTGCASMLLLFCAACAPGTFFDGPPPAILSPVSAADFQIVQPSALTLNAGGNAAASIAVTGINGFSAAVNFTFSGLPAGLTAAPSVFALTPGASATIQFTAAASTPTGLYPVNVTGTAAGVTHTVQLPVTILPAIATAMPDFTLTISPAALTLNSGTSASTSIAVASSGGFNNAVTVATSGIPAGVTITPSSFTLLPAAQQTVTVTVAAGTPTTNAVITFSASSGNLAHAVPLALAVAPVSAAGSPFPWYIRTNATSGAYPVGTPQTTAYDPAHKQFFVANPGLNEIDVFDALQQTITAHIPVPLPWGIDLSPVDGTLYAGTLIGDLYSIDPATLTVKKRFAASSIGPSGFAVSAAFGLADGRLALLGGQYGIVGVDGAGAAAVWDPVTNTLDAGGKDIFGGYAGVCPAVYNIGAFAVSGDRTRLLMTTIDEGGGGEPICSYDPVAKVATMGDFPPATFVRKIIPTPDGKRFFITSNLYGIAVFDSKTVQMLGQNTGVNPYAGLPSAASAAAISLDGKTLFLVDQTLGATGTFDTATLAQTGWVGSFNLGGVDTVDIAATDERGLLVGPTDHGVGFFDGSTVYASQPTYIQPAFPTPNTGPVSGGTVVTGISNAAITDGATLSSVLIGQTPAKAAALIATNSRNSAAEATTPPAAQTGARNITVKLSDGAVAVVPDAFTYGPTIVEVLTNAATAEGGQVASLVGYGFGQLPTGVQVLFGNQPAAVVKLYTSAPYTPYPFPIETLLVKVPPGVPGSAVDVTITTAAGTAVSKGAFLYTPPVQGYPLAATLQAGIYDTHRDVYYFSDTNQIQVLSRTAARWLAPIPLPKTSSATRLTALSLSPDGSQLAVSDFGGQAIYLLDPDTPSAVQRFPMPLYFGQPSIDAPAGLAVTNTGFIYYITADIGGSGRFAFHKITIATGTITQLGSLQSGGSSSDQDARVLLSPDQSKIYSSLEGESFWLDTSNDIIHYSAASDSGGGQSDLAVSTDGSTVDIDGYFTDAPLNPQLNPAYLDWEVWLPTATLGQKLNADGSLLLQPLTDGIDVLAHNTGRLLYRVQIPVTTADVYDSLLNAKDPGQYGVITATGVTFVDLSSLPVDPTLHQPFPQSIAAPATASSPRFVAQPRQKRNPPRLSIHPRNPAQPPSPQFHP